MAAGKRRDVADDGRLFDPRHELFDSINFARARQGEVSKFVGARKENATPVSYVFLLTALRTYFKMLCIAKAISERSASCVRFPIISLGSFLSFSLSLSFFFSFLPDSHRALDILRDALR